MKRIDIDILMAATKIRWSRMGKPEEEITFDRPQEEADLEDKIEEEIFLLSRKYNPETNKVV